MPAGNESGVRAVMVSEVQTRQALDYRPCRYGSSRLVFRGPEKPLDGDYIAVLGGSEVYGKYVADPFSERLEAAIGRPVVNLGCMHAGLTVIRNEPEITRIASRASCTILQVMGAQNMSNRFYTVHPRRNDRFVGPSERMVAQFPDIDFTEFHFTRHLLAALETRAPEGFGVLVDELRTAWSSRMRSILPMLSAERWLLWLSDRSPDRPCDAGSGDPLFVTRAMLDDLGDLVSGVIEVTAPASRLRGGLAGKLYNPMEVEAAAALPGPAFHAEVARAIEAALSGTRTGAPPQGNAPEIRIA